MAANEFLDLYKQLETVIENKGIVDTARYDNVVWGFMQSRAGARYKDTLNLCRELRNLLAHNPNFEGEPIATPSEPLVEELREMIKKIENPPRAIDFAVRGDDIFRADMNDSLLYVMKMMFDKRYTHIPVLQNGRLFGVLSESCIFTYMLKHTLISIDDLTPVSEISRYLPVDAHNSERYLFRPRTMMYDELRELFEGEYSEDRRLAAVFITENGKPTETILGLITPWDALGRPTGKGKNK